MTEIALVYYTVGLFAIATLRLVISTFYALKDTKTPLKIGIFVVIFNIILDLILVRYLAHAGIALATSIAAIIHLIILSVALHRKVKGLFSGKLFSFFWKICLASFLMGLSCWFVSQYFNFMLDLSGKIVQFAQVITSVILGLMIYYFSGIILGISEFRNARQIIGKMIKGKLKEEDINAY